MHDLEHPGAIMHEWWLGGAAQLEADGWSTAAFWMRLQAAYGRERRIDRPATTGTSNQHFHSG